MQRHEVRFPDKSHKSFWLEFANNGIEISRKKKSFLVNFPFHWMFSKITTGMNLLSLIIMIVSVNSTHYCVCIAEFLPLINWKHLALSNWSYRLEELQDMINLIFSNKKYLIEAKVTLQSDKTMLIISSSREGGREKNVTLLVTWHWMWRSGDISPTSCASNSDVMGIGKVYLVAFLGSVLSLLLDSGLIILSSFVRI